MIPITQKDMFLANAAGQVNSDLPTPITREEYYLNEICGRLDSMERPTDTQVQAAVDNYLDEKEPLRIPSAAAIRRTTTCHRMWQRTV